MTMIGKWSKNLFLVSCYLIENLTNVDDYVDTAKDDGHEDDDDDESSASSSSLMMMMLMMTIKVNTMAVIEAVEVVMERMSGRGGLIVNTASLAGNSHDDRDDGHDGDDYDDGDDGDDSEDTDDQDHGHDESWVNLELSTSLFCYLDMD